MTDAIAVSMQPAKDAPNLGEVRRREHCEPRCQPDRERWKGDVKRNHESDGRSEKRNGVIVIINAPQRQRLGRGAIAWRSASGLWGCQAEPSHLCIFACHVILIHDIGDLLHIKAR
jgi:hypothetical protein